MADFLTRLIERSRGLAPQGQQGQRVQPLIAPFYATGPNPAPPDEAMDDVMDDASVADPESCSSPSRRQASVPHITDITFAQRQEEHISIAPSSARRPGESISIGLLLQRHEPRDRDITDIKSTRESPDETQSAQLNQNPHIEPLHPATTPKSPAPPANERLGLSATAAGQSRHVMQEPLVIRPQSVVHTDESNPRVSEAANDNSSPIIRVTIGRIDVRAVNAPTAPARRATPPAPKLSLEEYLRSRSGRK